MRNRLIIFFIFSFGFNFAQNPVCNLPQSEFGIKAVTADDVRCVAKNSSQPKTIFFTFGIWCTPCVYHIGTALSFQKHYNAEVYVILIDDEKSTRIGRAVEYINKYYPSTKILVLKDLPSKGRKGKYKEFLTAITPKTFENIDDMSKYIVINKQGEVEMVTNYKDFGKDDWKDDRPMLHRRVVPLLTRNGTQP